MTDHSTTPSTPSIPRRFAACIYEFALLFGIYFITGAVVQVLFTLIGQTTPIWFIQTIIFLAFGYYFTYSWTRTGQTLAQKTWHIQITQTDGYSRLTAKQAWLRYLCSYLGVLPALLMLFAQMHGQPPATSSGMTLIYTQMVIFMTVNCLALLGTSLMNPERRTIHEILSGTRTVHQEKP